MSREFSQRIGRVKGSVIRELFKMMADPAIISLGGGSPAVESFPVDEIKEITDYLLSNKAPQLLNYGVTSGYMPLREAYLQHMVWPKGIEAKVENIIIFTGSGQGIDLTCEILLNDGDVVLVESPTFLGTLNVLRKRDINIIPVKMDGQGMCMDDLESKLKQYKPKMLYTIPTFQNPSGQSMPAERRQRVAELAAEYNFVVLEDDPYGDVRFRGEAIAPIKYYDKADQVVLMNSFSKVIAPGLRVGACVAPVDIAEKLELVKQGCDTHSSILPQAICAEFLQRGLMPAHLQRIADIYRERYDVLTAGIEKYFPAECSYSQTEGGMFVWIKLPEGMDSEVLLQKALAEYKVAFVHGKPFCVDEEDGVGFIRLNFSGSAPEQLELAAQRLGKLISSEMSK